MLHPDRIIDLFATCPPYRGSAPDAYIKNVREVARWSDEAGCKGILVYTDNSMLDPWLVSQVIVQNTRSLMPLVAVQPVYMHPYTVAKAISTLSYLYGRSICLNMVAGGFKNDLAALNDSTPHDRRYDRLVEYTTIIKSLLASPAPVTFEGDFYRVHQLSLKPPLSPELSPFITVSGSSADGLAAARALGATPVKYPEPASQCSMESQDAGQAFGIRVGIIARESEEQAWEIAYARFPPDRAGQIAHGLAMKVSDSVWHKTLSGLAESTKQTRTTYWLEPFEHYKTFCPYLVGTYTQVAEEIHRYIAAGCSLFILDVPASEEELAHLRTVFSRASRSETAHVASTDR